MLKEARANIVEARESLGIAPPRVGRPPGVTDAHRAGKCRRAVTPFEALKWTLRTGDQIRRVREEAGVSQGRLAEALGVHHETVSKWERTGKLHVWRLWQIAAALGVPVSHLISEEG